MLTIELPPDVERRLQALAMELGRSKADLVVEAVLGQLADIEDYHLAERTMRAIERGEERTYTLDEVRAELGLDDHPQ